jgi:hypothetical protein
MLFLSPGKDAKEMVDSNSRGLRWEVKDLNEISSTNTV